MPLTRERIAEFRTMIHDDSVTDMSWGEVSELESAFEEIPEAELPEPRENAGWDDMLDELEARLPGERCVTCHRPIDHDGKVWVDITGGDVCMDNNGVDGEHRPAPAEPPAGYRWAREDETDRPDAVVVMLTFDSSGKRYTQDEADLAVPE